MYKKFEEKLKEKLICELGDSEGNAKFTEYNSAKGGVTDILKNIVRVDGGLTDHDIDHCNRVLSNAYELLGDDIKEFSAIELYCLGICILFHDVGNVKGREKHKYEIAEQYDFVRKDINKYRDEKVIVIAVGEAHCGEASDGTYDTLNLLRQMRTPFLDKVSVDLCKITAVLRLADELDEGVLRTSLYALDKGLIPEANEHHKYAKDTKIDIDRHGERVLVTYHITIPEEPDGIYRSTFESYIRFIYERIIKLNQERQYTKHYCEFLEPFKEMSVSFEFWRKKHWGGTETVRHNLPPMIITDLVVPKDRHDPIEDKYPSYKIANLMEELFGVAESDV